MSATSMLHLDSAKVRASSRRRPGVSCATTCSRVLCVEDSLSKARRGFNRFFDMVAGGGAAGAQQCLQRHFLRDDVANAFEETVDLCRVQFKGLKWVGELE